MIYCSEEPMIYCSEYRSPRKRIELVGGVTESVWGPPREITLQTFRTDIQ